MLTPRRMLAAIAGVLVVAAAVVLTVRSAPPQGASRPSAHAPRTLPPVPPPAQAQPVPVPAPTPPPTATAPPPLVLPGSSLTAARRSAAAFALMYVRYKQGGARRPLLAATRVHEQIAAHVDPLAGVRLPAVTARVFSIRLAAGQNGSAIAVVTLAVGHPTVIPLLLDHAKQHWRVSAFYQQPPPVPAASTSQGLLPPMRTLSD